MNQLFVPNVEHVFGTFKSVFTAHHLNDRSRELKLQGQFKVATDSLRKVMNEDYLAKKKGKKQWLFEHHCEHDGIIQL